MTHNQIWSGFWLGFVAIISILIFELNLSDNAWRANNSKIISEMVRGGADPLTARCAVYDRKDCISVPK